MKTALNKFRSSDEEKLSYEAAAKTSGKSVSEWMREVLNIHQRLEIKFEENGNVTISPRNGIIEIPQTKAPLKESKTKSSSSKPSKKRGNAKKIKASAIDPVGFYERKVTKAPVNRLKGHWKP